MWILFMQSGYLHYSDGMHGELIPSVQESETFLDALLS